MFGPRIFVSYRRADSAGEARGLVEALKRRFPGRRAVFLDTSDIPYGEDFKRVIRKAIAASDVVLVIIGRQWLSAANERGPRLHQPDDPVRFEIETALARGSEVRVVPVRIGGAAAPSKSQLPESIAKLADFNMAQLRDDTFDADFNALVDQLYGRRSGEVPEELDWWKRVKAAGAALPIAALAVALAALFAAWSGLLDFFHIDTHVQRMLLSAGAPNSGEPVLLVGIDAASEAKLGAVADAANWRRHHARLIDRVSRAGATAVVFDIFFEKPTEADAELASAARRAAAASPPTRVVFGARRLDGDAPSLQPTLLAAGQWGSLCLIDRGGGALWSTPLAVAPRGATRADELVTAVRPSLALAALVSEPLRAADVDQRELRFDGPLRATPVRFSNVELQRLEDPSCSIVGAGDEQFTLLLRVAPAGYWRDAARSVSYADALDPARVPDSRFRDRVVLVGSMLKPAGGIADIHVVRDGLAARQVFGAELHADAIATLAGGRVPQLPTVGRHLVTTVLACGIGAAASVALFRKPRWWRRSALLALVIAWGLVAWGLATRDIVLNAAHDVLVMLLSYLALRAVQWFAVTFEPLRRPAS